MAEIALKNCAIKGEVVAEDPFEKNRRRALNYGHTIGHAVESASQYQILHGEAVAIGIIGAGLIERAMNLGTDHRLARIRRLFETLGVPTRIPRNIRKSQVMDLIQRDKKAVNRWPKFVLTQRIGHVYRDDKQWAVDVDPSLVEKVVEELYEQEDSQ
jgi:3-dehydroquinate synthase